MVLLRCTDMETLRHTNMVYHRYMPGEVSSMLVDWLAEQMKKRGWTIRETARAAGISHTPLVRLMGGDMPSFETCVALGNAFNVPAEDIMRRAGLLPKPPGWSPDFEEWNALYTELDVTARGDALEIVRTIARRKREQKTNGAK